MSIRNQPYIPLYIQDFLTDEKLSECSAASTGVYIKLMCLMHKSEEYGKILLKQKDKQTGQQINNFASKIAKNLPFGFDVVLTSLKELIEEGVLMVEGDSLIQKRMVKDGLLSQTRSESGKKGGETTQKNKHFGKAKFKANSEYEIEYENRRLKGVNFSENFEEVFFEDGSSQKLGKDQMALVGMGEIQASTIIKGSIY